jgi:hypothetical protein
MVAGLIAFAACSAIVTNALFLQHGPHPAPMFGTTTAAPVSLLADHPLPRPRPAQADVLSPTEPKLAESRLFDPRPVEPRPAEPKPVEQKSIEQRSDDPLANLVKATAAIPRPTANPLRPPALIPHPFAPNGNRRVAAVQRVLTEYGYGQLKQTGTIGPDTRMAIEKFESERHLPVTGQVTERLVHELAAAIGHPVE